jgi:hypothetical protein
LPSSSEEVKKTWIYASTSLERPRHRWVDNVTIHLGEMGWGGIDWIALDQDRDQWRGLGNAVITLLMG